MPAFEIRADIMSAARRLRFLLEENQRLTVVLLICMMTALVSVKVHGIAIRPLQGVDLQSAGLAAELHAAILSQRDGKEPPLRRPSNGPARGSGIVPGYAIVLLAMALVDPRVANAVECHGIGGTCGAQASFASVFVLQAALGVLSLVLSFVLALRLSRSMEVAMLTLVLVYAGSHVGEFAAHIQLTIWPPVLTILFMVLAVEANARHNPLIALGAGLAAGAIPLFTPLAIVIVPAAAIALALLAPKQGRSIGQGFASATMFLLGCGVVGWLFWQAIRLSYDPEGAVDVVAAQLSERSAFQSMGPVTWIASMLLPVPLLGGLAAAVLPQAVIDSLGLYRPGTYVMQGLTDILPRARAASETAFGRTWWLIETYMLGNSVSYLAVTPSILNRGLWGGTGIVGLIGLFHIKRMLKFHSMDGNLGPLLLILVPAALLFVINTVMTANHHWYNPALVYIYAYAIAAVVARFPKTALEASGADHPTFALSTAPTRSPP